MKQSNNIKFKNIAHLYMGCNMICSFGNADFEYKGRKAKLSHSLFDKFTNGRWKPVLKHLSKMNEKELLHLAWLVVAGNHDRLAKSDRITKKEIDIDIHPNDGGLQVDEDAFFVVEVTCRCYVGQIGIYKNGDLKLFNDNDELDFIERMPEIIVWYLKNNFDIFGLIESGQAINKNKEPKDN